MPLTGPPPEGRTFFCPHCGALYSVTHSQLSKHQIGRLRKEANKINGRERRRQIQPLRPAYQDLKRIRARHCAIKCATKWECKREVKMSFASGYATSQSKSCARSSNGTGITPLDLLQPGCRRLCCRRSAGHAQFCSRDGRIEF
jgi:hypothetical protein